MAANATQLKRLQKDCIEFAKEPITVEQINETYYGFGSELACLRIYYQYRKCDSSTIETAFSKNLDSWYFSLTPKH